MAKNKVEIVGIDTNHLISLSSDETMELIKKYKETSKKEYFDKVVLGNLRLVLSSVNHFVRRVDNLDDIFHIGVMGLLKSIENFDVTQNVKFSTYAVPMIEGEIRRYLRDNTPIRISRQIKDLAYHYMKEKEKYLVEYGEIPSNEFLEKILNVSQLELQEAIESTYPLSSLSEPLYNDFDESILLEDTIASLHHDNEKMITYLSLKDGISKLPELQMQIIKKRYYEGLSQVEISSDLKISQAQVSRLEKEALKLLKKYVI